MGKHQELAAFEHGAPWLFLVLRWGGGQNLVEKAVVRR